jgi:hypothetical protein
MKLRLWLVLLSLTSACAPTSHAVIHRDPVPVLTVFLSPLSPPYQGTYRSGTLLHLLAETHEPGWTFLSWQVTNLAGVTSATDLIATVQDDGPVEIHAQYVRPPDSSRQSIVREGLPR